MSFCTELFAAATWEGTRRSQGAPIRSETSLHLWCFTVIEETFPMTSYTPQQWPATWYLELPRGPPRPRGLHTWRWPEVAARKQINDTGVRYARGFTLPVTGRVFEEQRQRCSRCSDARRQELTSSSAPPASCLWSGRTCQTLPPFLQGKVHLNTLITPATQWTAAV